MATDTPSRRTILKSLTIGAVAGSVLRVIPLQAAEYAHHMIESEKTDAKAGTYTPKFFDAQQYKTLQLLCETIFPADADSGGAIEAGAPEFIDLLTSENDGVSSQVGRRPEVARFHMHNPLRQSLLGLHAPATNGDPRPHRLSQKFRAGRKPPPAGRIFRFPAQLYRGRILHQQDRNQVPRIQGQHLPHRIPWMPASARRVNLPSAQIVRGVSFASGREGLLPLPWLAVS